MLDLKTSTDEWYDQFCTMCEEIVTDYLRAILDKEGYWAEAECRSCCRKTAWHKRSGMRFLVEDFATSGNPKPGSTPHYFCSELKHIQHKYRNNLFISTILKRLAKCTIKDQWKVSPPCGSCACCQQRHDDYPTRAVRRELIM